MINHFKSFFSTFKVMYRCRYIYLNRFIKEKPEMSLKKLERET